MHNFATIAEFIESSQLSLIHPVLDLNGPHKLDCRQSYLSFPPPWSVFVEFKYLLSSHILQTLSECLSFVRVIVSKNRPWHTPVTPNESVKETRHSALGLGKSIPTKAF